MIPDVLSKDIKTLFDFLRNLGICLVVLLSIPKLDATLPTIFGTDIPKIMILYFTSGLFIGLYILNIAWLFKNLESDTKYRFRSMVCTVLVVAVFTLAIMGVGFVKVLPVLFGA